VTSALPSLPVPAEAGPARPSATKCGCPPATCGTRSRTCTRATGNSTTRRLPRADHRPRRHSPLRQLARRAGELPPGRAVVTVCRSGTRLARAAALLSRDGREASNLTGGMHAWAQAGLPIVARGRRHGPRCL